MSTEAGDIARQQNSEGELVIVVAPTVDLKLQQDGAPVIDERTDHPLARTLSRGNLRLRPIFDSRKAGARQNVASIPDSSPLGVVDHSRFFTASLPSDSKEEFAYRLNEHDEVEAAYMKPAVQLPNLNSMLPAADEPPSVTPDFSGDQSYLVESPGGIDAHFAWTLPGGGGAGVKIIDIEGAWRLTHEDLAQNQGGLVGGVPQTNVAWRNHGTAVMAVIGADRNGYGITGISPDANIRTISGFRSDNGRLVPNSASAIALATTLLDAGDILLIELHRPGPRQSFLDANDQGGYIPIEWWPDDYAAISAAVAKGIIVVEAGGNGMENLDDDVYDAAPQPPFGPFPSWWRNPFRRNPLDSGAILVGAGAPPQGTHGRNIYGPDRSKLSFSNYGAAIDVQGWGREVTTAGYGDKQGGAKEDFWYTDLFSGTSSASPIIVGALACLSGILRQHAAPMLTPVRARSLLRSTGAPQVLAPGAPLTQRIGNRPDLRQLVAALGITETPPQKSDQLESVAVSPNIRETKSVKITRETKEVREISVTRYRG